MPDDYHYPHSLVSLPVLTDGATNPASSAVGASALADSASVAVEAKADAPMEANTSAMATSDPNRQIEVKLLEGKVIAALQEIFDPEIPVNIYELGLIYKIDIDPDNAVHIKMTLTAPACPVAGSLPGEVETRVQAVPEVKSADVELVWEPPWSRDLMSETALLTLGML